MVSGFWKLEQPHAQGERLPCVLFLRMHREMTVVRSRCDGPFAASTEHFPINTSVLEAHPSMRSECYYQVGRKYVDVLLGSGRRVNLYMTRSPCNPGMRLKRTMPMRSPCQLGQNIQVGMN